MKKILIIEDDAALVLGLEHALQGEGHETIIARTGTDGYRLAKKQTVDLILLDVMLPGMSGLEVCKRLRDEGHKTPVLMLTSKAEENDKVLGLELGADDYLTKPFSVRELLARVKAQLRREKVSAPAKRAPKMEKFAFGNVVVDLKRHEVFKDGELQSLTNREFELLAYFIQHPGELLTRERLLNEIWGYEVYPTTRTVDNHVRWLRKHIEPDPDNPRYVKTLRGAGYLFELNKENGRKKH